MWFSDFKNKTEKRKKTCYISIVISTKKNPSTFIQDTWPAAVKI